MVENGYKLCWYGEDAVAAGEVLGFRPRVWNNFMATWGPTRRVYAYLVKVRVMGGPAWITHVRHISPLPLSYLVKVRVMGGRA